MLFRGAGWRRLAPLRVRGHLVGLLAVTAGMLVVSAAVASAGPPRGLAGRLLARDPAARLGGHTIVGTRAGAQLLGVPGRPNFIIALGSGETIRGGRGDDQLGALGDNDTIITAGSHEFAIGGPGGRIVANGGGHDLLIETKNDATVQVSSPADKVVLAGQRDRVVCGSHVRVTIYKRKGDSVSSSCRAGRNRVLPISRAGAAAHADAADAHAAAVTGNGSNADPYVAPCDNPSFVDCAVSAFPPRTLSGFWANEYVPAYQCPADHPYLQKRGGGSLPFGTQVPNGVQVEGLGPIAVSISVSRGKQVVVGSPPRTVGRATTTVTGGVASSATNWTFGSNSYKIILHCTSDPLHGH